MGLAPNTQKNIVYVDGEGKLSVSVVAAHPNGKELAEVLSEGVDCEVLSWEMDVEEPTAASIISQSLNKTHELALRTTELTAGIWLLCKPRAGLDIHSMANVGYLGDRVAVLPSHLQGVAG